jgi:hypothetical protein
MDLSAIIDEFNRRKAQAGQGIGDMLGLQKKPADWFSQMQQGQNAVINPQQRDNINRELADMVERFTAGVVPEPIRARDRAMQADPSAAAKPFTSEEVKGITPFVTAAAPIAYHGTPHTFEKFDASKIGTGQGAQSYGHGLYFAENPEVAKSYLPNIPGGVGRLPFVEEMLVKAKKGEDAGGKSIDYWTKELETAKAAPKSNLYQVNIPDQHAARMLDWDKPLSEQPEIEKLLPSLGFKQTVEGHWQGPYGGPISRTNPMGGEMVVSAVGNSERGSRLLQQAGIPGIKYLDQGSRNATTWMVKHPQGGINEFPSEAAAQAFLKRNPESTLIAPKQTSNFVVFDPAILEDVTRK